MMRTFHAALIQVCLFGPLAILFLLTHQSLAAAEAKPQVQVVSEVDLNRYVGKWYEIANIPHSFQSQCKANTTAEYALTEDNDIKVTNSCDQEDGTRSIADGRAKVPNAEEKAKLKVTFVKIFGWIYAFGGNYWILGLAPDYSYALVGDPSTQYAWLLSRTPALPHATLQTAEALFRTNGYDTCKILTSVQTGGFSERKPLCQIVQAQRP